MQLTMICCPFKTSYGSYASALTEAIQRKTGNAVRWVASNCGCEDPIEVSRNFQAQRCDYFEMPVIGDFRSKTAWKRRLRGKARKVNSYFRANKFARLTRNEEIVHFQQILNAYGSNVVFDWLKQRSQAARIVTVHELDGDQTACPERNKIYNLADGLIVHSEEMRQQLLNLGVSGEKVNVVLHGASIPAALPENKREGVIFYAGHKVMSGKGIQTLFKAMFIIGERMAEVAPVLKIHGHYGESAPEEARKLAEANRIAGRVVWLNQLSAEDMVDHYQQSLVCVLPYTGSFAGLPASLAAANQLPVVCTRKAGLADHLGDSAVWIEEDNPEQLAERVMELLEKPELRREIGDRLLKRAQEFLSWDKIAERTLTVYENAIKKKAQRKQSPSAMPACG